MLLLLFNRGDAVSLVNVESLLWALNQSQALCESSSANVDRYILLIRKQKKAQKTFNPHMRSNM